MLIFYINHTHSLLYVGGLNFGVYRWTADRDTQKYLPDGVVDHKNGTLTIDSVTEQDGRWKFCCDVSNSHGQQYECINLNVLSKSDCVSD